MHEGEGPDNAVPAGLAPAAPRDLSEPTSGLIPQSPPSPLRDRRRRPARPLPWIAGGVIAIAGFAVTVGILNATLYGPSGFVDRYLSAIDRRDLATALEMPGVTSPGDSDRSLLIRSATTPVDDAHVVGVTEENEQTIVRVDWRDGSASGTLAYAVEPTAPNFGVFSGWRFAQSPLISVDLTVANATSLRANGVDISAAPSEGSTSVARVAVLAPSRLTLDYQGRYLGAATVSTVAGSTIAAPTVDVQPAPSFAVAVQKELNSYLDECATQQVLQPSGCPFGTFVEDRLVGPPSWAISQYPPVAIAPSGTPGVWAMPDTTGIARVSGEVLSLFDGTRTALDKDVPFSVSYRITIGTDGGLVIAD